jgi:hypothetical protein
LMTIEFRLRHASGAQAVNVVILAKHAASNVASGHADASKNLVDDGDGSGSGDGRQEAESAVD